MFGILVATMIAGAAGGLSAEPVPQTGHNGYIEAAAFSPDGRLLLTGGTDRKVRLWDVGTSRELRVLGGHVGGLQAVTWVGDGRLIATLDQTTVRLFEADSGRVVRSFVAGEQPRNFAVSPDGALLATGHRGGHVIVWKLATGQQLRTLPFGEFNHGGVRYDDREEVSAVAFSPDGARIYAGGGPGFIASWSALTGSLLEVWVARDAKGEQLLSGPVAFSVAADGRVAAAFDWGSWGKELYLFAPSGSVQRRFASDNGFASVAFSPDGRLLLAGSYRAGTSSIMDGAEQSLLWDASTGKELLRLHSEGAGVRAVAFRADGASFVTAGKDARIWETSTGRRLVLLAGRVPALRDLVTTSQGTIWVAQAGGTLQAWELTGLRRTLSLAVPGHELVAASPDGKRLLVAPNGSFRSSDGAAPPMIVDASTGVTLHRLEGLGSAVRAIAWAPSGDRVAATDHDNRVVFWAPSTGKELARQDLGQQLDLLTFSPDGRRLAGVHRNGLLLLSATGEAPPVLVKGYFTAACFSPDGKLLATAEGDSVSEAPSDITLRAPDTGKALRTLRGHQTRVVSLAFSADGTKLASGSGALMFDERDNLRLWDVRTGAQLRALPGHDAEVTRVAFAPSGHLVSGSFDGLVRVWEPSKWRSASLVAAGAEWIVSDEEGRFDASPGGGSLVAMVHGARLYTADQFAPYLNRPDLLLSGLGLGTPELLAHLKAQSDRRLRKLGITASAAGAPPVAKLLAVSQEGREAKLGIELTAGAAPLRSWAVYVNGVPLFGATGKPTTGTSARIVETILLSPGESQVEVSCTDVRGVESLRVLRSFSAPEGRAPTLWFLGFGVSRYQDEGLTSLKYAHQDAKDLAALFLSMKGKGFADVRVRTLLDEEVTPQAIREARSFAAAGHPDDVFVLFIAGHGLHATDRDATYYFLPHATKLADLAGTAAPFELIEELLQGVPPRRKLFLMDTCESGESEAGAEQALIAAAGARGLGARSARGLLKPNAGPPAPRRPWLLQKDRYLYNDLLRRSGAIVFSSARGGELAFENDAYANGLFTEALQLALTTPSADLDRDGTVSTDELRRYVAGKVAELSDDEQHPTVDRDNLHLRFGFPVVAAPAAR